MYTRCLSEQSIGLGVGGEGVCGSSDERVRVDSYHENNTAQHPASSVWGT